MKGPKKKKNNHKKITLFDSCITILHELKVVGKLFKYHYRPFLISFLFFFFFKSITIEINEQKQVQVHAHDKKEGKCS